MKHNATSIPKRRDSGIMTRMNIIAGQAVASPCLFSNTIVIASGFGGGMVPIGPPMPPPRL